MPRAGVDDLAVRMSNDLTAECERLAEEFGLREHLGVRRYTYERAKHLQRHPECGGTVHDRVKPTTAGAMVFHVRLKRVDKDIHVWQRHLSLPSHIRSSSAALLLISTPGASPPGILEIGNSTRGRGASPFDCASTSRS